MDPLISIPFDPAAAPEPYFDTFPAASAVFVIGLRTTGLEEPPPYIGRTVDLRRRLRRLLAPRPAETPAVAGPRRLNLRDLASRIEYRLVGSDFETQWMLYQLNRSYYPHTWPRRLRLRPPALLKINLENRFPRCYPTRRISRGSALYYGPFPSRTAAERFAAEFLDFFKIRRCVEDLNPDPGHPGCIYSQMRMCLAPCFQGCTDEEYQAEVDRVTGFLDSQGQTLVRALSAERDQASAGLDFEQAGKIHRKIEKVNEVLHARPGLVRNLRELHAVMVQRAAQPKRVAFFRVTAGEIRGPATLSLEDRVSSPVSLDGQIRELLASIGVERGAAPWEHLSLLARWYYSSFHQGELVMLPRSQEVPHARLIRLCRKIG